MGNNLAVKITADIVDLQTKFGIARAEANALSTEFRKLASASALGQLDSVGSAQLANVAEQMLQAKQRAADFAAQMERTRVSTGGVGGALDEIRGKLATVFQFTGVAAAVAAFAEISAKLVELGSRAAEMRAMSEVLGVSVEQFQAMSAAADAAGISTEALSRLAERLVGLLQQARDGSGAAAEKLKALGITNEQIASTTFGANDALGVLHARLTDAATAQTEQNRLLAEFGPRGAMAIAVLKSYSGSAEDVAARIKELNGLNAQQAASAASAYASYKEFGTWLANTFTKVLDATTEGVSRAADVLLAAPAKSPALQWTVQVPSIAPQVKADAAEATATLQTVEVAAHAVTKADLDALRDTVDSYRTGTAERLAAMRQLAAAAKDFYPTEQADKYREIQRQLAAETRAYGEAEVHAEEQATSAMQRAAEIHKRLIDEQIADNQKYLNEQSAIAKVDAESAIAINRLKLQAQLDELNAETAGHRQSATEKYAIARGLVAQLAELDKEQLQNELSALTPGTEAYERAANQIKEVEARLQLDLAALKRKEVTESAAAAKQEATEWKRAVDEIESAESSLVGDLISRRKSLSQSLLSIGAQLVQQEIANDLKAATTRILIQQQGVAQEKALEQGGFLYHLLFQRERTAADVTQGAARNSAAAASAATQQGTEATAATTAKSIQTAAGISQIMSDAAVAAAGAAASVAAIPVVGWAMAPGVAAATYAEVAGYTSLASLDTGTLNVPQTGLYQLHQGEAVAPVPFAQGMRAAIAGGGVMTERGAAGTTHNYGGVTLNSSDTSLKRLLQSGSSRRALAQTLAQEFRRGARV